MPISARQIGQHPEQGDAIEGERGAPLLPRQASTASAAGITATLNTARKSFHYSSMRPTASSAPTKA